LVRRASEGEVIEPEAYPFEGQWLTSHAFLVTHPRIEERKAVIIVTIDNKLVVEELKALDSSLGRSVMQQTHISSTGVKKVVDVADAGSAAASAFTRFHSIPNTPWKISFTPSDKLLGILELDRLPVMAILGLLILASLASFTIVLVLLPRALSQQVNKLISAASKKTSLQLNIPELVPVAKQLRRATLRQSSSPVPFEVDVEAPPEEEPPPPVTTELSNPMFHSTSILDEEEEVLDLDLDLAELDSPKSEEDHDELPRHIFRAYDIRGIAETELLDETVARIGGAIASIAHEAGEQALIVACDGRNSSPRIKEALVRALMQAGRDVIDIGLVPTPLLYFATHHLECRSGVMITGSHNPADYNGLKIVMDRQTIGAGGINKIRDRAIKGDFVTGEGRLVKEDIAPAYIDEVVGDIAIAVPLKIVIDAGNGATSVIAPELFDELACEVIPLYCEFDGRFPNRSPDTSNEDNLKGLIAKVLEEKADFGVAFDGDGDRLAVVTSSGRLIRSDTLLMLFAQDVVSRNPGADVVFDVKCSRLLTQLITRYGGRPVLWKTGHAFMKEKMRETGALLGGEFSGHMFFGERWFGFDDGMYAAGRLAEILSSHGVSLDESLAEFPTTQNTPEIIIPVPENEKFGIIKRIADNADFSSGKVNTIDGIRVDYRGGWGLLRASNTSAALTARFEASGKDELDNIMQEFRAQIGLVEADLELPF
ncbi:MAG: phosphomannomutase/phosphoglucomutase, partial [Proteobacteria bacterium]|nr:phosphomannomutase/phosphoglucomutase [Pseudomonadota bacterium]